MELPLNGRNYSSLALLATNVHISPIAVSFGPTGTPREGAFNVNGMRSTYNNFLMDGLDNNSYGTSNQNYSSQVVQPSPDALAEFRVITSNFSAEYGRVGGGVVNAVLRSGTNQFHGTVYEFLRNTDLNAIGYVFGARPSTFVQAHIPPEPVRRDDRRPDHQGQTVLLRRLRGLPADAGLSEFLLGSEHQRPPGHLAGDGRQSADRRGLSGRHADSRCADQSVRRRGAGRSGCADQRDAAPTIWRKPFRSRDYSDKYDAKLDYQINSNMTAFLRFSQRKDISFFGPADPGPSGGDGKRLHSRDSAAGGRRLYLDDVADFAVRGALRIQSRAGREGAAVSGRTGYRGRSIGIQGLPSSLAGGFPTPGRHRIQQSRRSAGKPPIRSSRIRLRSIPSSTTRWSGDGTLSRLATSSWRSAPKFSTSIRCTAQDTYSEPIQQADLRAIGPGRGLHDLQPTPTSYDLADFYFGLPSTIAQGSNLATNLRQHVHSLYVQDDWRVTPKLTVNLGLRWEFATPVWERDNLWSNFDPDDEHSGARHQRQPVQSRAGESGLQGLRAAPGAGVQRRLEDLDPRRLRHQLHILQPAGQRDRRNQRSARDLRNAQLKPRCPGQPGFLTTQNGFNAGIATHIQSDQQQ